VPPVFHATHSGVRTVMCGLSRSVIAALAFFLWVAAQPAFARAVGPGGHAPAAFESRDVYPSAALGQAEPAPGVPQAERTRTGGSPPPVDGDRRTNRSRLSPLSRLRSNSEDSAARSSNCLILGLLYDLHAQRAGWCTFSGATPPPHAVPAGS